MEEFRKCFINFMYFDTLAIKKQFLLLKSLTFKHVQHRKGSEGHSIKKWEIYFFKIKIILFIINFR